MAGSRGHEEWRRVLSSAQPQSHQAQTAVLQIPDVLKQILLPAAPTVHRAAALLLISREWQEAVQQLDIWRCLEWASVSKSATRCDRAMSALCRSIQKWWGRRLTDFDAGCGCPIARELLTDDVLAVIARSAPHLRVVRLYGCMHVTDGGLKALAAAAPPLHTFSLAWCGSAVYLDGLRAVIRACPLLETFSISSGQESVSLRSVTDELVEELAACCPRITALELSDTAVGDAGLSTIATAYGHQLQSLRLNYTSSWSVWGLQALAQCCTELQFFSAASSGMTDDGLSMLGGGCLQLTVVCVDRCRQVSLDGIMRLVNRSSGSLCYVEMAGVYRQSTAEQQLVFGIWAEQRGMRFDHRVGLLAVQ